MDKIKPIITLIKTNRQAQIITASLTITAISLIGLFLISLKTRRELAFQQPSFSHPSPSPRVQTRFANHPAIINIEQDLPGIEASISALFIQKHPLLPPNLDMEVRIDK